MVRGDAPRLRAVAVAEYSPNAAAWVDRTLTDIWPELEKSVGPELMPRATRGRTRVRVEDYGCGHYGCVAPTGTPGVVFKLTSDGSEASFVSHALQIGEWPDGIVRYLGIYQVPDRSHRSRPLYVLWREEAFEVGTLSSSWSSDGSPVDRLAAMRIGVFKAWAHDARTRVTRAEHPGRLLNEARGLREWAEDAVSWDITEDDPPMRSRPARLSAGRAVAYDVRACEIIAETMEQEDRGYLIGRAFGFYLEHGILLADVHTGNVGRVKRAGYSRPIWVITDPGHMVPLEPGRMSFSVKSL